MKNNEGFSAFAANFITKVTDRFAYWNLISTKLLCIRRDTTGMHAQAKMEYDHDKSENSTLGQFIPSKRKQASEHVTR